ncbi:MAG: pyridoxal phosphate-dependent aminotransferase [Planctomycetota bacterium]
MLPISKMAAAVQPSATLAAGAKARQLKSQGVAVFDFSLGEPDFNTPAHIIAAAHKAMLEGHTHYTPAGGLAEVKSCIARWYGKTYNLAVTPEQVIVSNGAKHSLHNALAAMVGPGDEVIIPTPYWVSYSDLVQMTGATYKLVDTSATNRFKMTPQQFREAITPQTRLVMLNSPSNPTGSVYTRAELEALADVCLEKKIGVISDEIYEQLIYGDAKATCFATLRPGLAEQTVTISGISKTYAMTGWRIGWAVGPKHVIKAMDTIQSQETSCPSSISQLATIAALDGDQACVAEMRKEFEARRDLVVSRLNELPGVKCPTPEGAFYAFFDVSSYFGKTLGGRAISDSATFCAAALEVGHVNLVQGSAFGMEGYARLSFATSRERINKGIDRLGAFLRGEIG